MCSGAFFTVTVLTSVLPKTTCPASPLSPLLWVGFPQKQTLTADEEASWGSAPGKEEEESGRQKEKRSWDSPTPACMTHNDLLELSWIGLRWPGRPFHSCVFSLWMHHIKGAWILEQSPEHRQPLKGCKLLLPAGNTSSSQGTKSFSSSGLACKLQCQLYVSGVTQQ